MGVPSFACRTLTRRTCVDILCVSMPTFRYEPLDVKLTVYNTIVTEDIDPLTQRLLLLLLLFVYPTTSVHPVSLRGRRLWGREKRIATKSRYRERSKQNNATQTRKIERKYTELLYHDLRVGPTWGEIRRRGKRAITIGGALTFLVRLFRGIVEAVPSK